MTLIEDLITRAGNTDTPVREIITGHDWIMVSAGGSGVAARPRAVPGSSAGRETEDLSIADLAGRFRNRPLGDLLNLASSPDRFTASLGIAALNAALSSSRSAAKPRSFTIPRAGGKTVAAIGKFAFIEDLKRIAAGVVTIDAGPGEEGKVADRDGQTPDEALAGADIAIIRASTLADGTLSSWLARTSHCYTVIYGPSTPLSPVLFEYGADQLVGVSVARADAAADWIREGRDDLLACPGVRPVVLGRDQQPLDQQSR